MKQVELYAKVRYAVRIEGLSKRAALLASGTVVSFDGAGQISFPSLVASTGTGTFGCRRATQGGSSANAGAGAWSHA